MDQQMQYGQSDSDVRRRDDAELDDLPRESLRPFALRGRGDRVRDTRVRDSTSEQTEPIWKRFRFRSDDQEMVDVPVPDEAEEVHLDLLDEDGDVVEIGLELSIWFDI